MKKILLVPKLINETGGPGSFQKRLIEGITQKNIAYTFKLNERKIDAVLLINGTRRFISLLKLKLRGVIIVHRLGSPATLQNYLKEPWNRRVKFYLIQKYLAFMRRYLADRIVYQSKFVKDLWNTNHGFVNKVSKVIYNGTDFNFFSLQEHRYKSKKKYSIISVEGTQGNDPFDIILKLGNELIKRRDDFEIVMIGKAAGNIREKVQELSYVNFIGKVMQNELPYYYAGSDLYLLTDIIQAGCPNSAIEAMACGLPIVSYKEGPIKELVDEKYSVLIESENNPWLGEHPGNISLMADAVEEIFSKRETIDKTHIIDFARRRFSLESMAENYIDLLANN